MSLVIFKLFVFLFGPLSAGLSGVIVSCYIASRDMDEILRNFKRSYIIISYAKSLGEGSFGSRVMLIFIISGAIVWPEKHIRNGHLDSGELAGLAVSIKRRMKWSVGLTLGGVTWLLMVFALIQFGFENGRLP
jgi:hypothetical protein